MQLLFSSPDLVRVAQLKDVLEAEGIPCVIKNENLSGIAGEVPFAETFPELWIQNEAPRGRCAVIRLNRRFDKKEGIVYFSPIRLPVQAD